SLRVANPYPEMPVLYTPDQFRAGNDRLRIPTPPPTERPTSGSHLSELRKRRVSGHVVDSDIDLRCGRQGLMTAPVSSGRRRVAANFQGIEYQKTGSAVINNANHRGALNVPVVSVINGAQRQGLNVEGVTTNRDPFRNTTFTPASNVLNSSAGNDM